MTRSRAVVSASSMVVALGGLLATGAFFMDPARAAVGPLPAEALVLPADARFVLGFDVKRVLASPFYQKYAKSPSSRPETFRDLKEKVGIDPERDVDQVIVAGSGGEKDASGVVLVSGRFDRNKLAGVIEQHKGVTWKSFKGTTLYMFDEEKKGAGALAFLDQDTLLLGPQKALEAALLARTEGQGLRANKTLMGLVEKVRPGSTFWMVGDQSLLANLPASMPGPGGTAGSGNQMQIPALQTLTVTGDLDPVLAFEIIGEAKDEAGARSLGDLVRGMVALAQLQSGQNPQLKELATAISVTNEASSNRVRVNARLPYELLDSLQHGQPPAQIVPEPVSK